MTDDDFIAGFEDGSLDSFHHLDHVRMCFVYLCRFPALEALQRFSPSLLRFATGHAKLDLYNETVTWAFLLLIRERMARAGREQTWADFAAGNTDLLSWENNILTRYYKPETLSSDLAKKTFLLPDIIMTAD